MRGAITPRCTSSSKWHLKNSVRTAKKTRYFTITEINWLTVFKEINAVYSDNHMKSIKWSNWLLKQMEHVITTALQRVKPMRHALLLKALARQFSAQENGVVRNSMDQSFSWEANSPSVARTSQPQWKLPPSKQYPVHIVTTCFFKIRFNIAPSHTPQMVHYLGGRGFKISYAGNFSSLHACLLSHPTHLPAFDRLTMIWCRTQIMKCLIMELLPETL
jgi:hypothetical protein